jgi:hypothetical protein
MVSCGCVPSQPLAVSMSRITFGYSCQMMELPSVVTEHERGMEGEFGAGSDADPAGRKRRHQGAGRDAFAIDDDVGLPERIELGDAGVEFATWIAGDPLGGIGRRQSEQGKHGNKSSSKTLHRISFQLEWCRPRDVLRLESRSMGHRSWRRPGDHGARSPRGSAPRRASILVTRSGGSSLRTSSIDLGAALMGEIISACSSARSSGVQPIEPAFLPGCIRSEV